MKTIIHVDQHVLKANIKNGTRNPPITVKTYKTNSRCKSVVVAGPLVLSYNPDDKLACGASVWMETWGEVTMFGVEESK